MLIQDYGMVSGKKWREYRVKIMSGVEKVKQKNIRFVLIEIYRLVNYKKWRKY